MNDAVLLRSDNVHVRREGRDLLGNVTFDIARGELVAIMGPSGSGKTTMLRAIAGLDTFHAGVIEVDGVTLRGGEAPSGSTLKALRRRVGMLFQFHCLFEHLSVMDNVCLAPVHVQGVPRREAEQQARRWLTSFGVEHRAAALPRQLSGGEAQRVAIARAMAMEPQVLLLDEPTASLDPERRAELGELLGTLRAQQRALLVVTHDDDFAKTFASRILRVQEGRLRTDDSRQ